MISINKPVSMFIKKPGKDNISAMYVAASVHQPGIHDPLPAFFHN
jgi:hypothetical protein